MVFCDCCNICVHQACYGITSIPDGSWLCRTCSLSQRPDCVLCPNKGGAMKCTRSGQKWAHVSCALWIPEVSIGCVERMEPITKISSIPVNNNLIIIERSIQSIYTIIERSIQIIERSIQSIQSIQSTLFLSLFKFRSIFETLLLYLYYIQFKYFEFT